MKKLINLIAFVMLVSTNVFTPFSYAQVDTTEVIPENGVENVVETGETPEYIEEFPENTQDNLWELEQENQEDEVPEDILSDIQDDIETPIADETENVDTESDKVAYTWEETSGNEKQDEEEKFEELEKKQEMIVMDVIPNTTAILLPWLWPPFDSDIRDHSLRSQKPCR